MDIAIKQMLMSTVEMRSEVAGWLEELDETFLAAVHAMVGTYVKKKADAIIGYEIDGSPLTVSEFVKQADEQVERAKAGEGISVDELRKRSEEWLARLQ